jgi:hypothetical protein
VREYAIDLAASIARLNASRVPMSGFGAPKRAQRRSRQFQGHAAPGGIFPELQTNVGFQTLAHVRSRNEAVCCARRAIGEQLRAAYEETVQEPIPSRHLDLCSSLSGTKPGMSLGGNLRKTRNRSAK